MKYRVVKRNACEDTPISKESTASDYVAAVAQAALCGAVKDQKSITVVIQTYFESTPNNGWIDYVTQEFKVTGHI